MCIPRVSKGILGQIPRAIYSHTEVSLRYFYLMDYYLISTGTGISIYTRPMSLAPTIDHIPTLFLIFKILEAMVQSYESFYVALS